ncbi:MAG: hypothetical protein IT422_21415 [Pirellulaceae bacterium]|nr:hypothetical protein [Pirellulaceae bacterium]
MTSSTEEKVCLDVVCLTASARWSDVNSLLPTLLACTRMAIELQSD